MNYERRMAESSLKHKTTVSLFWSFLDKFGQQLLNFVSMLVLMNIVAPDAYGMIGSLALFTAFSTILIDSGFGRVLINRKEVSRSDYSAVFYFNVGLSALIYLLLFFTSPLIANLFNTPALVPIARVLFLMLLFNAFGLIQQTLFTKDADFKTLTRVNISALLIADVVAIALALLGLGVWALVAQLTLYALLRTIFLWVRSPWRPLQVFAFSRLKKYFGLGYKLLLSNTIATTMNNIYPSLIALFHPMSQVAYFNQAKKYQEIPFLTLSNTFRSVAMLILSMINEQSDRLQRVVRKLIKSIAFLSFPIAFLIILIAEPTFHLFFREKWMASVPYFQVLTLGGMLLPFTFIFNELFIAKERAALFLGIEGVKAVLLVFLIVLLFPKGIMGLAVSWVIYMAVTLLLSVLLSGKVIHYSLLHFIRDTFPYLFIALISAGTAYWVTLRLEGDLLLILANALLVGVIYIALCKLLKLEMSKEIEEWFSGKRRAQGKTGGSVEEE
ncbi:MAG: lipopolysaccharide biosynthesis protein [Fermentimonas sp.]